MDRIIVLISIFLLAGCTEPGDPWYYVELDATGNGSPDAGGVLPELDPAIEQIFADHGCVDCHGGALTLGGLNLTTMAGVVAGGSQAGPSIVACDPESSPLVHVLEGGIDDGTVFVNAMPKGGAAVSAETLQAVRDWIAAGAGLESCEDDGSGVEPQLTFEDNILPIFEASSCMGCHGNGATLGGLDLSSAESLLTGGTKAGASIIACEPDVSPLVMVVEGGWSDSGADVGVMPPTGDMLAEADVATIRSWIGAGAGVEACGDDPGDDGELLWSTDVRPLLEALCGSCHTASGYGTPKFMDDEATLDGLANHPSCAEQTVAECIHTRMAEGTMPLGPGCDGDPGNDACPTEGELQLVRDWVDAGAPL